MDRRLLLIYIKAHTEPLNDTADKMNAHQFRIWTGCAATALALLAAGNGSAQQPPASPPAPQASAGVINDWLRAQDDSWKALDLGGQFRTRLEYRDHLAIPGVPGAIDFRDHGAPDENSYWLFRTKLHMGFKPTDWAGVYVEGRDSFSSSDLRDPELETDRLDLHQAYLALGDAKRFPLTAKVGRQELAYGDERLVGAFDWNNIGRVFDAAKVRYETPEVWVDAFAGRVVIPRDRHFNEPNDYDWFWGLYGSSQKLVTWQETQLYFLGRNASEDSPRAFTGGLVGLASPRDIYTVGTRMKSLPGTLHGWDYSFEAAGQFGSFQAGQGTRRLEHEAYALHAGGGYIFARCPAKPRLGVEYNFASGDSNPTDGEHGTFENLFPTNHKFYGFMDVLSWQNMHNVRLNAAVKPLTGLNVTLDYHLFWLADTADYFYMVNGAPRSTGAAPGSGTGYNLNPGYDSFVGSELDLVATYALKNWANLQAGYGHFFTGDYVEQSLGAPTHGSSDADWVYVQVAINF